MTYQQITDQFLAFEKKHNLLYLEVCGVFPWQITRVAIFLTIVDHYIAGNTTPEIKSLLKQFIDLCHRVFVNFVFFNPYLDFKKKSVLIFDSGRKYFDENENIDIYTKYLCEDLEMQGISFTQYETNYNVDGNFSKRNFKNKHLDSILLISKIKRRFKKTKFSNDEKDILKTITENLTSDFGVDFNLEELFAEEINKFKIERELYQKLFRLKKPQEIFITNSCEKAAMIDAAKMYKVLVNELQHGLISEKSVVSNFPGVEEGTLQYFPDRFYYWYDTPMCFGKLPIKKEFIIPFRNEHIARWIEKTKDYQKDEKTILIISQPYSSDQIQKFVLANLVDLEDYTIIYKLHPVENIDNFSSLKEKISEGNKITFVNNEESMYVLLKKAKYAIGIYSSSLFEAVAFDCKVILLNLPGVEMSFPLLKNKDNILLSPTQKLSDFL